MQIISNKNGGKGGSSYPDGESRSSRYQKLLQNVPEAEAKMFDHTRVEAERRFQRSQPDTADELELDEQRKDFVKKLYKTWSRK